MLDVPERTVELITELRKTDPAQPGRADLAAQAAAAVAGRARRARVAPVRAGARARSSSDRERADVGDHEPYSSWRRHHLVQRGLRITLGRILPLFPAAERGQVEVGRCCPCARRRASSMK